jgi:predicted nucleic-acid-binding protein
MIGLDTNIVVRLAVRDDARQVAEIAILLDQQMAQGQPCSISVPVLLEAGWVLQTTYGYSKAALLHWLDAVLASEQFFVASETALHAAIETYRKTKIDFAGALIVAVNAAHGCTQTITFDKVAIKSGLMTALPR